MSFKAAAREVHVTPSAVSHSIQTLEDWLGVKLFVRDPKGLRLTREGKSYLRYVSEALGLLTRGTQVLPGFGPRNALSISCAPTFASRWLIPNLKSFRDNNPEIDISVDTFHRQVDLPGDDVDIAIRRADGPWPDLHAVPLAQETLFPVASPEYLARAGPAKRPEDLTSHTVLRVSSITEDWPSWFRQTASAPVSAKHELYFDAIHLALDAAVHGLGIALGRRPLIDEDIASGRLLKVMGPEVPGTTQHWLLCSPESADWPEILKFRSWIGERLKTDPSG